MQPITWKKPASAASWKMLQSKDHQQDKKISKISRRLAKIAPEPFYWDTSFAVTPDWTTGSLSLLNQVPQNDADVGRTGDKITMTSIMIDGYCTILTPLVFPQVNILMKLIYVKKEDFGGNLQSFVQNVTSIYTPFTKPNFDIKGRYQVLWEKRLTLDVDRKTRHITIRKSLKGKKAAFIGATTAYAYGALYFVTCSDHAAADAPSIVLNSRLNYIG